jgi:hypothetical protein
MESRPRYHMAAAARFNPLAAVHVVNLEHHLIGVSSCLGCRFVACCMPLLPDEHLVLLRGQADITPAHLGAFLIELDAQIAAADHRLNSGRSWYLAVTVPPQDFTRAYESRPSSDGSEQS